MSIPDQGVDYYLFSINRYVMIYFQGGRTHFVQISYYFAFRLESFNAIEVQQNFFFLNQFISFELFSYKLE